MSFENQSYYYKARPRVCLMDIVKVCIKLVILCALGKAKGINERKTYSIIAFVNELHSNTALSRDKYILAGLSSLPISCFLSFRWAIIL